MRYLILLTLSVTTAGTGYFLRDKDYWLIDNLAGNLAAGFLGSLAVLFFIERAIDKKREEERNRLAALAVPKLQASLQRIVGLLADMIKASAPHPICSLPTSLGELFSPANTAGLDWFDLDGHGHYVNFKDWRATIEFV